MRFDLDPTGELGPLRARALELQAAQFLRGPDPGPAPPPVDAVPRARNVPRAPMAESQRVADFLRAPERCTTCGDAATGAATQRRPTPPSLTGQQVEPPPYAGDGVAPDGCVRYPDGFLQGVEVPADATPCAGDTTPRCAPLDVLAPEPPCSELPFDPQIDDGFVHAAALEAAGIDVLESGEPCAARRSLVEAALFLLTTFAAPGEVLDFVLDLIAVSTCNGVDRRWPNCIGDDDDAPLGAFVPDIVFQLLRPYDWGVAVPDLEALTVTLLDLSAYGVSLRAQNPGTHVPPRTILSTGDIAFDEAPGDVMYTGSNVYVNLTNVQVEHILGQWLWGDTGERTCAALRLSALILHEILHLAHLDSPHPETAGLGDPAGWHQDTCNAWLVIVNTYLWAAAQRLGWLGGGPGCCFAFADLYFFNDCWSYYLRPDTLPKYTGPSWCVATSGRVDWHPTGCSDAYPEFCVGYVHVGRDLTSCTQSPPPEAPASLTFPGEEVPGG